MATLQQISDIVDSARNISALYSQGSPYFTATDVSNAKAAYNALSPQEIKAYTDAFGAKSAIVPTTVTPPTQTQIADVASKIAAEQAATTSGINNTTPSGSSTSSLNSGTGTVVNTKPTTSIGALDTKPTTTLSTSSIGALDTKPTVALDTKPVGGLTTQPAGGLTTQPANITSTGSIPALTTADLASWGKTLPQGLTSDQLTAALNAQQSASTKAYTDALAANQTALTKQNEEFLKNWNTSADALKTNILSGVDTKNQAFGTQATQGFMDAFKNFQIPTNQQTGVNLGNYNDNRNAAADQWWSQYVTGRR